MFIISSILAFALQAAPVSEQDRMNAARTAYEADDYATAVRGFESLAHDFPASAKYHYYAGLARENAGQDSHAYFHMHMFLASGAGTPDEKKLAAERAAAIARRTTRVRLQLPAEDIPAVLHLTYRGPKSPESRPVVIVPLAALPHVDTRPELALEPGTWELTINPPIVGDLEIQPKTVEITAGTPTLPIRLETKKSPQQTIDFTLDQTLRLRRKITIELRREGLIGSPPIILTTKDLSIKTALPVGTWTYKATGRGLTPIEGKFTLARPIQETLTLRSDIDDAERRRRRRLGLGLMGTGLATATAGAVVMIFAAIEQRQVLTPDIEGDVSTSDPGPPYKNADHFIFANTGMGLLGGSAGTWIAAASSSIRRPRGWTPALALGTLLTAGGIIWAQSVISRLPAEYNRFDPDPHLAFKHHLDVLASTFMLGLGTGLLVGAATGILSVRKNGISHSRASLNITPGPRSGAFSLRLTF